MKLLEEAMIAVFGIGISKERRLLVFGIRVFVVVVVCIVCVCSEDILKGGRYQGFI